MCDQFSVLYVADLGNNRIRKISIEEIVSILTTPVPRPIAVAVAGSGNVYVADQYNERIRAIKP